jgi:outer membrane protein OmpA-like peptidoglycan-associated protein
VELMAVTPERSRVAAVLAAPVAALVLATAACGLGDDDAAGDQVAGRRDSDETSSTDAGPDAGGGSDVSAGRDGGAGSELDRDRSDAASDVERRVSETLSELGAQERGGDTVITLPERVLFEFDQDVLLPEAATTLDGIAEAITFFEDAPVQVNGHTDSRGDTAYNQDLSERRARAVVDHLVEAGVEPGRLSAQGFGETQPVAPNQRDDGSDNPEGRAQNRRVEVVIEGVDPADLDG